MHVLMSKFTGDRIQTKEKTNVVSGRMYRIKREMIKAR